MTHRMFCDECDCMQAVVDGHGGVCPHDPEHKHRCPIDLVPAGDERLQSRRSPHYSPTSILRWQERPNVESTGTEVVLQQLWEEQHSNRQIWLDVPRVTQP